MRTRHEVFAMTFNEEVKATRRDTRKYEGRDVVVALARYAAAQRAWRGSTITEGKES